jgi:hypothetical protein
MKSSEVLSNNFRLSYDEAADILRVYTVHEAKESPVPIELRLDTLKQMGRAAASAWVGETILLLIPAVRTKLFGIRTED